MDPRDIKAIQECIKFRIERTYEIERKRLWRVYFVFRDEMNETRYIRENVKIAMFALGMLGGIIACHIVHLVA